MTTHKHYIIRLRSAKQKQAFLLLSLNHGFGTIDNPLSVSKVDFELLTDLESQTLRVSKKQWRYKKDFFTPF